MEISIKNEHIAPMDGTNSLRHESDIELEQRIAWEAKCIAEAQADIDAGRVVSWERVRDWMSSIGTAHELPPPRWQP